MSKVISFEEAQSRIAAEFTAENLSKKFNVSEEQARKVVKDTGKLEKMLRELEKKLAEFPGLGGALAYVPTMISLVRSFIKKEYTDVPIRSIAAIALALAYVLAPIDLIPDSILGVGMLDDASVVRYCLKLVKDDLDAYRRWRGIPITEEADAVIV